MDAQRAREAIDSANLLRERLVHGAYALHFAAAETAELFEHQAQTAEPSTRREYENEAKRWRDLSVQAFQVVRVFGS